MSIVNEMCIICVWLSRHFANMLDVYWSSFNVKKYLTVSLWIWCFINDIIYSSQNFKLWHFPINWNIQISQWNITRYKQVNETSSMSIFSKHCEPLFNQICIFVLFRKKLNIFPITITYLLICVFMFDHWDIFLLTL